MIRNLVFASACVLALGACKQEPEVTFNTGMPMSELMGHVIDPGAWAYWNRSGEVMQDDSSYKSRVPAKAESIPEDPNSYDDDMARIALEEEWHAAISGAAQVAEAGNLLLLPGRVRKVDNDNGDWSKWAAQLTEVATRAMEAAENQDGQAMFDIGGEMFQVCRDCHDKYLVPFLNADGELPNGVDAEGNPVPTRKE